jgi:anti-sigma factor RsiW
MRHIKTIRLSAFLDDEVSEEERTEISEHLKVCSSCRKEAGELSQVSELFTPVEDVQVSPYFLTRLKLRISEEKARSSVRWPFLKWIRELRFERIPIPAATAALLVLALMLGSRLGTVIYQERLEEPDVELAEVFSIASFDDFPEGSLGESYVSVFSQGGE